MGYIKQKKGLLANMNRKTLFQAFSNRILNRFKSILCALGCIMYPYRLKKGIQLICFKRKLAFIKLAPHSRSLSILYLVSEPLFIFHKIHHKTVHIWLFYRICIVSKVCAVLKQHMFGNAFITIERLCPSLCNILNAFFFFSLFPILLCIVLSIHCDHRLQ